MHNGDHSGTTATYAVVGKSVQRGDTVEKALGTTSYTVDLQLPGMLHAKILHSAHPHARIVNIDVSKAQRLTGVRAIATGEDMPYTHGYAIKDQPFLATGKVRYMGEAVAVVAAGDIETAQEALSLISVEYEPLPAVFDPEEAMAEGAPVIHENLGSYEREVVVRPIPGTNACSHYKLRKGNVDEAFQQADCVFEDRYTSQMVQHAYLEPHAVMVQCHPNGRTTFWSNTQSGYTCRRTLAYALGIPANKLRFITSRVGGGFGGKLYLMLEPVALAAAMKTNCRPVSLVYTREEELTASLVRHPVTVYIKSGVMKDGNIVAREVRLYYDTGAYAELGPIVCRQGSWTASGPYKIPNLRIDGFCVYTNQQIAGPFRGFGIPQANWAYESQMDAIAERLGMDPLEIRLRNALEEGCPNQTGQIMHSVGLKECLRKAADHLNWGHRPEGVNRGKGIACMHKPTATPSSSSACVQVSDDGTVTLISSAVEMGQGSDTVLSQIVAEELGVPYDAIIVTTPDTDTTPFDQMTSSSRSTFHMGNAVRLASIDARNQLFELAAQALEARAEDLEARAGVINVKGVPGKSLTVPEVIQVRFGKRGGAILGKGTYTPEGCTGMDPETGQGAKASVFWMFAAQAAEVEVDTETGQVRVHKLTAAHDLGKAINPLNCEQQIQGALATGLGCALFEDIVTEQGRTLNPSFVDYKLVTALDAPPMVPILVEEPHNEGPFGAKGLGEPGLAPTAAAIANAIYDAVGVRITSLPITPEKILRALKEKKGMGQ